MEKEVRERERECVCVNHTVVVNPCCSHLCIRGGSKRVFQNHVCSAGVTDRTNLGSPSSRSCALIRTQGGRPPFGERFDVCSTGYSSSSSASYQVKGCRIESDVAVTYS